MANKRGPALDELPDEILLGILLESDPKTIINLSRTNKRIHNVTKDEFLWKNLFKKYFPELTTIEGHPVQTRSWQNAFIVADALKDQESFKSFSDRQKILLFLAKANDIQNLKMMLKAEDLNTKIEKDSFLYELLKNGSQELYDHVYTLVQPTFRKPDAQGRTLGHWAAICNKEEYTLLQLNPNLNAVDHDGNTPLEYAASLGRANFMNAVFKKIDNRISLARNLNDETKNEAFLTAVTGNHIDIVKIMLPYVDDASITKAVSTAALADQKEMVNFLLATKLPLNADVLQDLIAQNKLEMLKNILEQKKIEPKLVVNLIQYAQTNNKPDAIPILNTIRLRNYLKEIETERENLSKTNPDSDRLKDKHTNPLRLGFTLLTKRDFTIPQKMKAAEQLLKVMKGESDKSTLKPHLACLDSGKLQDIYQTYLKSEKRGLEMSNKM